LPNLTLSTPGVYSSVANFDLAYEPSVPASARVTNVYLYGSYVGNFGNKTLEGKTASSAWQAANLSDQITTAGKMSNRVGLSGGK